jgi:hypothetical protein
MKTRRFFGWAVIFTVTLLLAACDTNSPKVADTNIMSGSDETMTQYDNQLYEHEDSAILISQEWLNEREREGEQRELYQYEDSAIMISQAWLNEREMLVEGMESLTTSVVKLAGVDSSPGVAVPSATRVEAGRCYARVVFPAEYKTVAVIKQVSQPSGDNLPVLYQSVIEKVKVTDEQMRWEEILCEDRMTECRISEVQRALYRGGYKPGPINGIVGQQTMAAINAFQKDFNLSVANHLTIETVKALDANF